VAGDRCIAGGQGRETLKGCRKKEKSVQFDAFLKRACPPRDLDWRKYRRRSARHRVLARMAELGLTRFEDYLDRLDRDAGEAAGLAELMAVTVSRFFREAPVWKALEERVLPRLLAASAGRRLLRAWSVGCAGGEEPYSLALLWHDRLQPRYPRRRLTILASDVDESSLERARLAIYGGSSLREIPLALREKWFAVHDDRRRLIPLLAARVRFLHHNFMEDPQPGTFDLVLVRYLPFTYYRGARRLEAAQRLWRALRPGGALMIGAKENLQAQEGHLFAPWPGTTAIYCRRPAGAERAGRFVR
jgi:chemotaxis protein methyltransferase CheR